MWPFGNSQSRHNNRINKIIRKQERTQLDNQMSFERKKAKQEYDFERREIKFEKRNIKKEDSILADMHKLLNKELKGVKKTHEDWEKSLNHAREIQTTLIKAHGHVNSKIHHELMELSKQIAGVLRIESYERKLRQKFRHLAGEFHNQEITNIRKAFRSKAHIQKIKTAAQNGTDPQAQTLAQNETRFNIAMQEALKFYSEADHIFKLMYERGNFKQYDSEIDVYQSKVRTELTGPFPHMQVVVEYLAKIVEVIIQESQLLSSIEKLEEKIRNDEHMSFKILGNAIPRR